VLTTAPASGWTWHSVTSGDAALLEVKASDGDLNVRCSSSSVVVTPVDARRFAPLTFEKLNDRALFVPGMAARLEALARSPDLASAWAELERLGRSAGRMSYQARSGFEQFGPATITLEARRLVRAGDPQRAAALLKSCQWQFAPCREVLETLEPPTTIAATVGAWKRIGRVPAEQGVKFPFDDAAPTVAWVKTSETRPRVCVSQNPSVAKCFEPDTGSWADRPGRTLGIRCEERGCTFPVERLDQWSLVQRCPPGVQAADVVALGDWDLVVSDQQGVHSCLAYRAVNPEDLGLPNGNTSLIGNRLRCHRSGACSLECVDVLRKRPAVTLPGPGPAQCASLKVLGDSAGRWILAATQADATAAWELFVAPVSLPAGPP
jgi:hypothetical protein